MTDIEYERQQDRWALYHIISIPMLFIPAMALAQTPWQRDCVTWWGGDIPRAERTQENCPNGRNHWDGSSPGIVSDATKTSSGVIITNNSTYVVNRVGSTVSVIRSGR
jgi:hypothetical protein